MASVQMEGLKKIMLQMMDNGMTPTFGNNIDADEYADNAGSGIFTTGVWWNGGRVLYAQ